MGSREPRLNDKFYVSITEYSWLRLSFNTKSTYPILVLIPRERGLSLKSITTSHLHRRCVSSLRQLSDKRAWVLHPTAWLRRASPPA